ncbi:hypothetical protein ACQP1W_07685 [Spirillospora sp. CA-255316]
MRPDRSTRWTRLLAVLAALLLTFTTTPALAAPPTAAPPSPSPQQTELLLPQGTPAEDREAIDAAAQRLADDPRGRELIRVWRLWQQTRKPPGNISVHWFDFNWMHDNPRIPTWLQDDTGGFVDRLLDIPPLSDDHQILISDVDTEFKGDLYEKLGVPKSGLLLQVAAGNTLHSNHSEENALNWYEKALRTALHEQARERVGLNRVGKKTIEPLIRQIMQASPRGLAGQRVPCAGRCDLRVQPVRNILAIAYYAKHGSAANKVHAGLAQRTVPEVMRSASNKLTRRGSAGFDKPKKNLGLEVPKSGPACSTGGLGGNGGGGQPMALVGVRLKAPCGPSAIDKMLDGKNLGGVDFSTLEMRYMSDGSSGVKYSFSGKPSSGGVQDPETGLGAITTSTADLRTWLALDPSKFWVNLNPSEPNRIVDDRLGETNAGRALLEADFAMKRTQGKMIDPDTEFGARYWRELLGISKTACYSSRMWIVPGDVQVREDGDSLYVIKADLSVKAKAERIAGMSCTPDPAGNARSEDLEQKMIVPKVIEAVNKDPEYAPLRRAFLARVIAQWIRKRHQEGHRTSFDRLIDSGDLGPARLQGTWRPRQVFDRYVHSIRSGEFTYEQPSPDGRAIIKMTFGGVDFSKLDSTRLSAAQMDQRNPRLAQTVQASQSSPTAASDGSIWLGETAEPSDNGLLSRTVGSLRSFTTGRNGIIVIIVGGLVIVTFGFGIPGRKRRPS